MEHLKYLAYTEDVQGGRVERPHEEVLRPQRLHDHRLPRPREVCHRVIPPHRVAEAPSPPVYPRVYPIEIPGKNAAVRMCSNIKRNPNVRQIFFAVMKSIRMPWTDIIISLENICHMNLHKQYSVHLNSYKKSGRKQQCSTCTTKGYYKCHYEYTYRYSFFIVLMVSPSLEYACE